MEQTEEKRTGFYRHKISLLKFVARDGVSAIVRDVFENQSTLVDVTAFPGHNRILRWLARQRTEERHFLRASTFDSSCWHR